MYTTSNEALPLQEQVWENEGGAMAPETNGVDVDPVRVTPPPRKKEGGRLAELLAVGLPVVVTHALPVLGLSLFAHDSCHTIATLFALLSAYLLTARVVFQDNPLLSQSPTHNPFRVLMVQSIGAAVLLAWLAPFYATLHAVADVYIAAMGVIISILTSSLVGNREGGITSRAPDLASVLVVGSAFVWCELLPHFRHTVHGADFLSTVTIGASSLHGWRVVLRAVAKVWAG